MDLSHNRSKRQILMLRTSPRPQLALSDAVRTALFARITIGFATVVLLSQPSFAQESQTEQPATAPISGDAISDDASSGDPTQWDASLPPAPVAQPAKPATEPLAEPDDEFAPQDPTPIIDQFKAQATGEFLEYGLKAVSDYEASAAELRKSMFEMRAVHTRMLNGLSDNKQEYYDLRDATHRLINQTYDEALKVMEAMPHPNAVRFVVTWVEHRVRRHVYDAKTFEGAAKLLDTTGAQLRLIYLGAARSAMCIGRFDVAERIYKSLKEEDLDDLDKGFIGRFDVIKEQFLAEQERLAADPDDLPKVKFKTSRGDFVVELYINEAPSTVSHFIELVESGYYDGLDFFQVIEHLLALTGDELGDGSGKPDRYIADEHGREDVRMPLAGSLVMAKLPLGESGNFVPDTAGTQFAIIYVPFPPLIQQQTIFGRVTEGMDIVCEFRLNDPNKKKKKGAIVLPPDRIFKAEMINRPETLPEVLYVDAKPQGPAAMPQPR